MSDRQQRSAMDRRSSGAFPGEPSPVRGANDVTLDLPEPTGPCRVGSTALHLVDGNRRDPWEPVPVREVMATVFYPADDVGGCPVAPQMSEGAAAWFGEFDPVYLHPGLPDDGVDWAATTTHSHTSAPAQTGRRPVLLYSPGGFDPRALGTGLAEELAGHGYVVVTVDHPGETSEVEFPDGRVRGTVLRGDPAADAELFRTVFGTRVADIRFVLDQLETLAAGENPDAEERPLPEGLDRALDPRRVGVYGHSAGGTTVAQVMYEDRRVLAAVSLEGYLASPPEEPGGEGELFPIARHGADRPLFLLGTEGFRSDRLERSWSAVLAHPGGRARRSQLGDAMHWVFTDYAAMAPQLQADGLMTADERIALVGAISPEESVPAVRDHVLSFFARHVPATSDR